MHCYRKPKRTNDIDDWRIARHARNRTKNAIKHAKSIYITELLENNKNDAPKFWKTIKTILPNHKSKNNLIHLINQETRQGIPESETAQYINDYFSSVGAQLSSKLSQEWSNTCHIYPKQFQLMRVNTDDVINVIKNIDISKSSGIDYISSRFIKDAFLAIVEIITHLFNVSINSGCFPTEWKIATVVPIPKNGDPTDINNLRPISILPLPGKLLEKIVHNQYMTYLEQHNILDEMQGGFRKNKSTISTIVGLTDDLYTSINQGDTTSVVFIDFRKAFDSIDHQILVAKIATTGVNDLSVKWFQSYLTNRSQITVANNIVSKPNKLSYGVPQGSILGPLLFLVFINDLRSSIRYSNHWLYADDACLYTTGPSPPTNQKNLQADLLSLIDWCINTKKTKLMNFGTKMKIKRIININMEFNGELLHWVSHYKYLGVILDSTLTFNNHIQNLIKVLSYKSFCLSKLRHLLNNTASVAIYKSTILPYVEYGDNIYAGAKLDLLNKIQRIQNRCLRVCLRAPPRTSIMDLHKEAKVNLLVDRRASNLLKLAYKRKDLEPYRDTRQLPTRGHDVATMKVPQPHNTLFMKSVLYRSALAWNALPPETKAINSYPKFKYQQKTFLRSKLV